MAENPVGPLLDALGVTVSLADSQQLVEAVVIGKAVGFAEDTKGTALIIGSSGGLDWIAQRGLIAVALDVLISDLARRTDDE